MQRLILKNGMSPGDIVMLTAAVRDLHFWHPGQFLTDVRTACPELWENNPHITPLSETDPGVELIECSYPLINHANARPYHCLHGFIEFLNDRLKLAIKPTRFKGDIHLSALEKSWYSQVHEVTGQAIPFWIVVAGGKHDLTTKWWKPERFQQVVDHFRGKIQFVQIGQLGHHHPKLNGTIDLRGKTNLRELVRLIYHSDGTLCGVTAAMHLAAAVEVKSSNLIRRACVVVAGGREPSHWEAYPDHQFIHTNGTLSCCRNGGCWKDRVAPLRDGDKRDRPQNLCVDVVGELPRCLDMISAEEVIRRVELYYQGGALKYLSTRQNKAAKKGIAATRHNKFDDQPLTLHSAGMACDRFIETIPSYPGHYRGRGIVICGGGVRYFTNAWVCLNRLRRLGCQLPVQIWHLGPGEMTDDMKSVLAPLGAECVDAHIVRQKHPIRRLGGWELKAYAILHSPYEEVILLDADNVPLANPEKLFETPQYQKTGAIFWPDYERPSARSKAVWHSCGLRRPNEQEFESGQIVVDKQRCWRALQLSVWFNAQSDFYYRHVHGDKETFHLAFRKVKKTYSLIETPIHPLLATMCQHDFDGRRIFQHRNFAKWNLVYNKGIPGFWKENECRHYLRQLHERWDGGMGSIRRSKPKRTFSSSVSSIATVMISCPERMDHRQVTLKNLARTDWGAQSVHVLVDDCKDDNHRQRQTDLALRALRWGLDQDAEYLLFLEDDLDFNRHFRHNLEHWRPLRNREITLGSLYNPNLRESAYDVAGQAVVIDPNRIFGSQAFLISRTTIQHVVRNWGRIKGMQDIKISRLAGRLNNPVYYHCPSLVQHLGSNSVWGGGFHQAPDFDPNWKSIAFEQQSIARKRKAG